MPLCVPRGSGDMGVPAVLWQGAGCASEPTGESRCSCIKALCVQARCSLAPPSWLTKIAATNGAGLGSQGGPAVSLCRTTPCAGCPSSPLLVIHREPLVLPHS